MHHLTKDILTTKITKVTKDSDTFDCELRAPFDIAQDMLRVLRGDTQVFLGCGSGALGSLWLIGRVTFICLALFANLIFPAASAALELPALTVPINDFAKMMPPASVDDLKERLKRIRSETGYNIAVLTVQSLEGEAMTSFGDRAFKSLPLADNELQRAVLLIVARKEQTVSVETGVELRPLFPQPAASRKLQTQVEIYFNGMRPDLGIHAGVHYIYGVIRGDFRLDRTSEEEKLENTSKRGAGAGAIFAVFLGPFLAFFAGVLWGVYATHYGVQRELRLFIGAVLGGGTAQLVALLMAMIGGVSDGLWYFIFAVSVPLGVFGSLTEYWMGGDWSGIPRVKDAVKRKPEDNMGI